MFRRNQGSPPASAAWNAGLSRTAGSGVGWLELETSRAKRSKFPWRGVPGYVLAQAVGGVAAALFLRVMSGTIGALGATTPGSGISSGTALAIEVVLTAGLVNTILVTASATPEK